MIRNPKHKNIVRFSFSLVLLALLMGIWGYVWMKYFAFDILRPFGYKGNWLLVVVYGIIVLFFSNFYGGYQIGNHNAADLFLSNTLSLILSNGLTYLQTSLVGRELLWVRPFLYMTLVQLIIVLLWSYGTSALYEHWFPPYKMLLLYQGREMAQNLVAKMAAKSNKYIIQEVMNVTDAPPEDVMRKIDAYENIILCDLHTPNRNVYLKYGFKEGKRIYTTPKIPDILMRTAWSHDLFDTPLLLNTDEVFSTEQTVIKRTMDIVLSALALLVLSPFFLLSAVAIKLYDGGPVIYKQERLTQHGKRFFIYKFRSMIVNAEKDTGAQLSPKDDPRITPIGRIMRTIRFDELPQLWNVLKGDMSLVGPRPERPEIAEEYMQSMPEFEYRLKVKAGITGYAQVYGKYNTTPYDKLKMDLVYISGYHLLLDFKILLLTIKILFLRDRVEGVIAEPSLEQFPQNNESEDC